MRRHLVDIHVLLEVLCGDRSAAKGLEAKSCMTETYTLPRRGSGGAGGGEIPASHGVRLLFFD